jgi:ATP-binding cassette subfamily B protein
VLITVLRLRPYRRSVAALAVLQVAQAAALLLLPTLNAAIIDDGVVRGDIDTIVRFGGLMLVVTLVQVVCAVGAVRLGSRIAMAVGRDLRAAVFERVRGFSALEVGRFGTSSLITRTTNDVQQVQAVVLTAATSAVAAPILCVGAVVLAFGQDVRLAFVVLALVPLLGLSVGLVLRWTRPVFRTVQQRVDVVNRVLREQITGIRVIRAFRRDEHEQRRFGRANDDLTEVASRSGRLTTLLLPLMLTTVNVVGVPLVWFARDVRIGVLIALLGYLVLVLTSAMMASALFMAVPRAEVCAERIDEVLRAEPSIRPSVTPVRRLKKPGHLDISGADFAYPGAAAAVLCGIDLVARPGTTTAIIGSTGSGKSTVLGLVPRLFDVTGGRVLVGGEDVRDLDPALLAATVGLVQQKTHLFSGTVASNLRYGRPDATDAELRRALEVAHLEIPTDQPVSQSGTNLSGGQRQRLAIARMLVRRPEVYLFDDSFSALDHTTDAAVRAALAHEIGDKTVVVVAQRVSTIRDADRIVVLDEGRVVGAGTHHELATTNGTYREIVLSQEDAA